MRVKYGKPRLKQSEIASKLRLSSSTPHRYRNDTNMLSLYRINQNNTNKQGFIQTTFGGGGDFPPEIQVSPPLA